MSEQRPVNLSSGLPETVLDPPPSEAVTALEAALAQPRDEKQEAVAAVAATWPTELDAWARLGYLALGRAAESGDRTDQVAAYAYFRVGYHRGLDRLRQAGWRGSGYVRWQHPGNRGFLRALAGLGQAAEAIGEADEARRCAEFVRQLDPDWDGREQ